MSNPWRLHRISTLFAAFLFVAGLPLAAGKEEREPIDVYVLGSTGVLRGANVQKDIDDSDKGAMVDHLDEDGTRRGYIARPEQ